MKPQLYLPDMNKKYLKNQIGRFVDIYFLKLKSVFENNNTEAEEYGDSFFEGAMQKSAYPEAIDPADIAEEAMNRASEHWDLLNHGRYVYRQCGHSKQGAVRHREIHSQSGGLYSDSQRELFQDRGDWGKNNELNTAVYEPQVFRGHGKHLFQL